MKRHVAMTMASVMVLSVVGYDEPRAPSAPAPVGAVEAVRAEPAPGTLDVTCSFGVTTVSADHVVAAKDGVHLRVRNPTGARHVALNYGSDLGIGGGGGDPVPAGTSARVLDLAPGPGWLECGHDNNSRVPVTVRDPAGYWRSGAVTGAGCLPPAPGVVESVQWAFGAGRGTSADAALTAVAQQVGAPMTWVAAQEGYVAAADQIYVLRRQGRPWATAIVQTDGRGAFSAMLDLRCHPPSDHPPRATTARTGDT